MRIKQQKQIKSFLIEEFGIDKGNALFDKQETMLNELIKNRTYRNSCGNIITIDKISIRDIKILASKEIEDDKKLGKEIMYLELIKLSIYELKKMHMRD